MREYSYSQISEAMNCGYRWHLQYVHKITTLVDPRPLKIGTYVHRGVEAVFKNESLEQAIDDEYEANCEFMRSRWTGPTEELIENLNKDGEHATEAVGIVNKWKSVFRPEEWVPVVLNGVPLIEHKIEMRLFDSQFVFVPDLVAHHINQPDVNYVIDWKVRSTFQDNESEIWNFQKAIYQFALMELGVHTAGSRVIQIYNKAPRKPSINKDGSISRAAAITDWDTYKKTIEATGNDPEDYMDMKVKLDGREWVRENIAWRSPEELIKWAGVMKEWVRTINNWEMQNVEPPRSPAPYRCNNCRFRKLCQFELMGYDISGLMGTEYTLRTYAEEPEIVHTQEDEEND